MARFRTWQSLILLAVLFPCAGVAQPSNERLQRISAAAEPLVDRADFAGVIAIHTPEVDGSVAFGWADRGLDVPNDSETRFGIGSVSKQLTAAVILRLVDSGALSLADSLSAFFPEFSEPPVTVHQLLAHKSGLARDPFNPEQQIRRFSAEQIIDIIAGLPREFPPGERTSYSNSGFVVLALLAEQVAGKPFCEALRELVLAPLDLEDTGCLDSARLVRGLAHGYDPGPGPTRLRPAPHYEWTNTTGAGGLYSTAGDLVKWGRAILDRELLSEESWHAMLADHGNGRGYGVGLYTRHGHEAIGHDGVINGYTAFVEVYPDKQTVVAYAGNIRAGGFGIMQSVATAVALREPVENVIVPEDEDLAVQSEQADSLVGRYELFPGFHLDIDHVGQRLYLTGTGGYPTVLSSLPNGDFFYRSMYAAIRFGSGEEGPVLVWIDRRGQEYEARKLLD